MPYAYFEIVDPPGGPHPEHPIAPGGRPSWGNRPDHELPGIPGAPGHPGHRPVDPNYGIEEGGDAGQLPVWPLDPEHPDTGLPPVPGHPLPPIDPPPGTIWPPLPPSVPAGKALILVFISGVGYRYAVVEIPEHPVDPDYGIEGPDDGGDGEHPQPPRPGQGLPGGPPQFPNRPGQGLPGQPPQPPVRPGQGLPPQRPPAQPGQGLPGQRPGAGQRPGRPQPK